MSKRLNSKDRGKKSVLSRNVQEILAGKTRSQMAGLSILFLLLIAPSFGMIIGNETFNVLTDKSSVNEENEVVSLGLNQISQAGSKEIQFQQGSKQITITYIGTSETPDEGRKEELPEEASKMVEELSITVINDQIPAIEEKTAVFPGETVQPSSEPSVENLQLQEIIKSPNAPMAIGINLFSYHQQDVWNASNDVYFYWWYEPLPGTNLIQYAWAFDQVPSYPTMTYLPTTTNEEDMWFFDVVDGEWYFHLQAEYWTFPSGGWTPIVNYRVRIDTSAPSVPSIDSSTHPTEGTWYPSDDLAFNWSCSDSLSGINGYSYVLDESSLTTPDTVSQGNETSVNFPNEADGIHYFHIRARNGADLWGPPAHYQVNIDATGPVTLNVESPTHPSESTWYSANDSTFSWSCFDTSGITGYSYQIDTSAVTTLDTISEGTGETKSYTNLADGTWYFHIHACNGAGIWGLTVDFSINIDTTAPGIPVISSGSHAEAIWVNNNDPSFSWTCTDASSGVAGYSLDFDQSPGTIPNTVQDQTEATISYPDISDGTHYLHVRAVDNLGFWGETGHYEIRIDTVAPEIPVVSSSTHVEATWTDNNDPAFSWTCTDAISGVAGYSLVFDQIEDTFPGESINQVGTSKVYADVADGTYYFHVRAVDNAGAWCAAVHYEIRVDTVVPVFDPVEGFSFNHGEINHLIVWSVSELHPDNYTIFRNSSVFGQGDFTATVICKLDGLEAGDHNFTCVARDLAGGIASSEVWITVLPPLPDETPPELSSPPDFSFEEGSIGYTITWSGSDNRAPWWATVRCNGMVVYDSPWIGTDIVVSLDDLSAGVYEFNCTVTDEAGNWNSNTVVITVTEAVLDIEPPLITSATPVEYEEGTIDHYVNWICYDAHPYAYRVLINGEQLVYNPWRGENISICVDGLAVGLWVVNLTLWDLAGNVESDLVIVTVLPPSPDISPPAVSQPTTLTVLENTGSTIVWEVSDDHPGVYSIFLDGSAVVEQEIWMSGIIRYTFAPLPVGTWIFNLTVWDLAGNWASSLATVESLPGGEFDTDPPQISQPPDQEIVYGSVNNSIVFYLFDQHPDGYCLYFGSFKVLEHDWDSPNVRVSFSLDGLAIGNHEVNLTAWDAFGNKASRLIGVAITGDDIPPVISSPPDVVMIEGMFASVFWEASDTSPSHFEILVLENDTVIDSGTWSGGGIVFDLSLLTPGSHTLRCIAYDKSGNFATDDVAVMVYDSEQTEGSPSPGFEVWLFLPAFLVVALVRARLVDSKRRSMK